MFTKHLLFQLSYFGETERTGLEPVASGVTDQRSNQLSYRSKRRMRDSNPHALADGGFQDR